MQSWEDPEMDLWVRCELIRDYLQCRYSGSQRVQISRKSQFCEEISEFVDLSGKFTRKETGCPHQIAFCGFVEMGDWLESPIDFGEDFHAHNWLIQILDGGKFLITAGPQVQNQFMLIFSQCREKSSFPVNGQRTDGRNY